MQPVGGGGVDSGSAVVNNDRARAGVGETRVCCMLHRTGVGGREEEGRAFLPGSSLVGRGQGLGAKGERTGGGRQQRQCECAQRGEKKGKWRGG